MRPLMLLILSGCSSLQGLMCPQTAKKIELEEELCVSRPDISGMRCRKIGGDKVNVFYGDTENWICRNPDDEQKRAEWCKD